MIQLVIAWACVGFFVATGVITLLALTKVIELADKKYLGWLVKGLVLEIVVICLAAFAGYIERPATVEKRVKSQGIQAGFKLAVDEVRPRVAEINTRLTELAAGSGTVKKAEIRDLIKKTERISTETLVLKPRGLQNMRVTPRNTLPK